jgi:flagellar motor switch protein FliM
MKLAAHIAHLPAQVKVLLGTTRLTLDQVARLDRGAMVLLEARITDPVRGTVGSTDAFVGTVVADHGNFGVKIERNLVVTVEESNQEEDTV